VTTGAHRTYAACVWLKEVVFQGLFGVERPARLSVEAGFCSLALPQGADPYAFLTLLVSILYPNSVSASRIVELSDGDGRRARIGAVFTVPGVAGRVHKIYRRADPESIVIQEVPEGGRGREIARGVDAVAEVLARMHGLPADPEEFSLVHCADFGSFLPSSAAASADAGDLVERYRDSVRIERLENEISELDSRLADVVRDLRKLGKRDKRLADVEERVAAIDKVLIDGGADLVTVRGYERASEELEGRIHGFQNQIVEARAQQDAIRPRPMYQEYALVAGATIALIATIASLVTDMRPIALVNLGAFTLAGWALLRRFGVQEEANGYMTRVEQVYRHVEGAQEERGALEREFRVALRRLDLEAAEDVADMEDEREQLQIRLTSLAGRQDPLETRTKLADLVREERELGEKLDALRSERSDLGDYTVSPFELERQLEAYGVSVADLRASDTVDARGLFAALAAVGTKRRQIRDGRLTEKTAAMFGRFGKHLLGQAFANVGMDSTGTLDVIGLDAASVDRWIDRGGSEVRLLAMAFNGALLATSPAALVGAARILVLSRPYAGLDDAQRRKTSKLFDYLGKYIQVLVLEAAA
jgi:hypothetical protein